MTIFTAKWVYTADGIQHERLIETDQVHTAWDERTPDAKNGLERKLGAYDIPQNGGLVVLGNCYECGDSMAISFGTVYVMNRDGKTVAKYHLPVNPPWDGKGNAAGQAEPDRRDKAA
jgi:hypothetical protein